MYVESAPAHFVSVTDATLFEAHIPWPFPSKKVLHLRESDTRHNALICMEECGLVHKFMAKQWHNNNTGIHIVYLYMDRL